MTEFFMFPFQYIKASFVNSGKISDARNLCNIFTVNIILDINTLK